MLIKDIFKYFSAFVPKEILKRIFQTGTSKEYNEFLKEVLNLPSENRNSGITDFIFGVNEDKIKQRISEVSGPFLFVEYSRINSTIDTRVDLKKDSFHISTVVASPQPDNWDLVEEALKQDYCLDIIKSIRQVIRDNDAIPFSTFTIEFPTIISPFVAKTLSNSYGWSMEFDISGVDIV